MNSKKAESLRREWGKKSCEHPDFAKETILGAKTGDHVCTQCGESFSPADHAELEQQRKARTPDQRP